MCSYVHTHPDQIMRRDPSLDPSTNFNDFARQGPYTMNHRHTTSLGYTNGPAKGT